jgi:hypothetical protein
MALYLVRKSTPFLKIKKPRKDYADSPDDSVSLATPKKGRNQLL